MDKFEKFCRDFGLSKHNKTEHAVAFLWFHCRFTGEPEGTLLQVEKLFERAKLPQPNLSRLREGFRVSPDVHKGSKDGLYRISRDAYERFESSFGSIFAEATAPTIVERADLKLTPLLDDLDRQNAQRMAELYVILHCYENSARRFVEKVFKKKLGDTWWDQVANVSMKQKVGDRQAKEQRNRWITPRGTSPLFYLDWDDLLTLIRKHQKEFEPHVPDYKFVELRFEELERFRNIVAHHGVLPSDDEFQAVILSFKQWCRQVGPSA